MSEITLHNTQQAAFPFFAIHNHINGSHDQDLRDVFKHTSELCCQLARMLYGMPRGEYTCQQRAATECLFDTICDVFEGERYGMGSCICEMIEQKLNEGRQLIYDELRKVVVLRGSVE